MWPAACGFFASVSSSTPPSYFAWLVASSSSTGAAQCAFAVLRFRFALDLGGDRDLVAFDRHLNVLFPDTGNLGVDYIGIGLLGDVDLDRGGRVARRAHRSEEPAEQLVDPGVRKGIVDSQRIHDVQLLSNDWGRGRSPQDPA